MAIPSEKSEAMENMLIDMNGFDRRIYIKQDQCVPYPIGCLGPARVFSDDISEREFVISGMCEACQKKTFK